MAPGIATPLQLTASAALLNNTGIKSLPTALTAALTAINATTLFTNFSAAVTSYQAQSFANDTTLAQLLSIGNSNCPALGNSIPAAYTNLDYVVTAPFGFSGLVQQTGDSYLGDGSASVFAQGFLAVQGYLGTVNKFINSVANAQTYLGPTFTSMDRLITNDISNINPNFGGFGIDLAQQGQLWNPADMALYGTPAGLLRQLAAVGRLPNGVFGDLRTKLLNRGLSSADISQLLEGQGQLSTTEFNTLQRLAYLAMTDVTGDTLNQVLSILDVTLPNINTMADLLNPVKTFPRSYNTMNVPVGTTWQPVYNPGTSVNLAIAPAISAVLPTASGCDELAKVIPPDQAVANKAIQISMQQVTGLPLTTLPALAEAVQGYTPRSWDPAIDYLPNSVVSNGYPTPTFYQAQQSVPAGTNITDTAYWLPTTLGGLNTLAGLPLLQAQTAPLDPSVVAYYNNNISTGSGVNGTITTCDVIGTAIDTNDFAADLNTATTNINSLQTAGALTALNNALVAITSALSDAAVLTQIANANAAIAAIVANPTYATQVAALNTAWNAIASALSQEKTYQTQAGVDYAALQADGIATIMAFVLQLPQYGLETEACGACYFLEQVADTSILGGQAIVGAMREGQNNQRLADAQLDQNYSPSSEPAVTPIPVVNPVY